MKTTKKETFLAKYKKYQNWILNPKYIEQEIKGERLLRKLEIELSK